jgi:hypothetical protein
MKCTFFLLYKDFLKPKLSLVFVFAISNESEWLHAIIISS